MIYYDDFRAFAKEHEDEIFAYFVRDGEDAAQYGTIIEVVPLPDADFLIGSMYGQNAITIRISCCTSKMISNIIS